MSTLHFKTNFHSFELQQLIVPVEVRKTNLALVAKGVSSEPLEISPGTYHVSARLPGGQEMYNRVTIEQPGDYTVVLELDPEDVSPSETQEIPRFIVGNEVITALVSPQKLEALGAAGHPAGLRAFKGSPMHGLAQEQPPFTAIKTQPAQARFTATFSASNTSANLVQLLQPEQPPLNFILPAGPDQTCRFLLALQEGAYEFDVELENLAADALLRYLERGLIAEVGSLISAETPALISEELLLGKVSDPIAATVAAYSLLRLGELDRLHEWTENLFNWFPWLPDGAVIRAEHLARTGKHTIALTRLLELENRGLPFFSDGVSYAVNRLRQYVEGRDTSQVSQNDLDQGKNLLNRIKPFSLFMDYKRSVTCYMGLDPNQPADVDLGKHFDDFDYVDVSTHLG
jgi:hypothetical protein